MPNIDLSILNQRQTPAFYADVFANRPAAGFVGRIFVSTNTFAFYRDNGTGWDLIGGPGTGTITGSGTAGTVPLWNGASTIGDSSILEGSTKITTTKDFQADGYYLTGMTAGSGALYYTSDRVTLANYNPTGTVVIEVAGGANAQLIAADLSTTFYGNIIRNGGTSSQFLKADGSLDSSAYVTTNIYNGNGTLSGERTISLNGNNLIFDGGASIARVRLDADTNVARIFSFATNNVARWAFRIDGTESGSDAGSDFAIRRYNDAGTFVDAPLTVTRSTGQSTFAKKVVIENNAGDQQLQIVSTTAPSLRFDNLQTGATKRAGLGISTATNNFIQGSADRDFCIFNGSTAAASPILFGIYDAGLGNTQEAARISAARNLLVGTSVDSGYKIDVSGGAGRIASSSYSAGALLYLRDGAATGSNTTFAGLFLGSSPGTDFVLGKQSTNTVGSFAIKTGGGTSLFTLSDAGAATFSNNVTIVGNDLDLNNGSNTHRFTNDNTNLLIRADYTGASGNSTIQFSVDNNEVFRATSSLNVLIGTTTDNGQKLQVNGTIGVGSTSGYTTITQGQFFSKGGGSMLVTNALSGGVATHWELQRNDARIFGIGNDGSDNLAFFDASFTNIANINKTTGVYTATSDKNKKKNFEASNLGLDAVLKLKPTLYNMISQSDHEVKELGFIAQEVKEVINQAYVENGEFIGLNYQPIVATLVKAIQELNTKIENLK